MKKSASEKYMNSFSALVAVSFAVAAANSVLAAQKEEKVQQRAPAASGSITDRAVRAPNTCGQLVFDRNSGTMVRTPNVDLVVSAVQINVTSSGVWITPTIKNLCSERVTKDVHVLIDSVVVTVPGLPGNTDVRLGHAVGVAEAPSHTVTVDYDERIPEANERNNRCTRSTTGSCN